MRYLKHFPKPPKEPLNIFRKSSRDNNTKHEDNETRKINKIIRKNNKHPNEFLQDEEEIFDHA